MKAFFDLSPKMLLKSFLGLIISIVLSYLFYKEYFKNTDYSILNIYFPWLILSILCVSISYFFRQIRWGIILEQKGLYIHEMYIHSCIFNSFLPLRAGDLYRIHASSKIVSVPRAIKNLVIERILDLVFITLILFFLIMDAKVVFLFISISLSIAYVFFFSSEVGKKYFKIYLLTISSWVFEAFAFYFTAYAILNHPPLFNVMVLMPVGALSTIIPSAPGAIGTYDFFVAKALSMMDYKSEFIINFTLVTHLQLICVPLLNYIFLKAYKLR